MSIVRILLCIAGPLFVLALVFGINRTRYANVLGFYIEERVWGAPRFAGACLVTSIFLTLVAAALAWSN